MTDYHALRAAVASEAATIAAGSTITILCPKCVGGQSGERKMSVSRSESGAMFLCHRASCNFRGFVGLDGAGFSKDAQPKVKPTRPFYGDYAQLSPADGIHFYHNYKGIRAEAAPILPGDWGLLYMLPGPGHVFVCRGFNGELLGHTTRTPDKVVKTYRAAPGADMYSVYEPIGDPKDDEVLVIVEDCISAMACASHGYTAIALLGTHLSCSVREKIVEQRFPIHAVMLDPDAEHKALQMRAVLPSAIACIGAPCDPKDNPNLGKLLEACSV